MRQTSARILKALHEGYVLRVIVDRCQEDPDEFYVQDWQVEEFGGVKLIEATDMVPEYKRKFSERAVDDLQFEQLLEWVPNTGTNALYALTTKGLAFAQEMYGHITAKALVKHEDGIEIVEPAFDGKHAEPTGEITVPDSMEGDASPRP